MKYEVVITQAIDSSHQLKLPYESGCNNLHGHRWNFEVGIESESLNKQGMVVDFQHIKELIKVYDHYHLNDCLNNFDAPATAETLAVVIYGDIKEFLESDVYGNPSASVTYIKLWETPSGCVIVKP